MAVIVNNDNKNAIEEIDRKNAIFISELMNKDSFMIDWYEGAVLSKNHPRYYDGRIEVNIRKVFNNSYGNIAFGRDEYQISDEVVDKLYNYIETNIDKLIKISLNQNTKMYEGISNSLSIKYKSLYISISEINTSSEEETKDIINIKNDIKNIIFNGSRLKEDKEIDNETIETVVNEIVGPADLDKNRLIIKLVNAINSFPFDKETTIAELMQLKEVWIVEPLIQGEVYNAFLKVCDKLNIKLVENRDEIGGLGYHYKFKKINSKAFKIEKS